MLVFHIVTALFSLLFTSFIFFWPSAGKLNLAYSLVALTVTTGTYLVWSRHLHILSACLSGLVYLGVVGSGLIAARFRFTRQLQNSD